MTTPPLDDVRAALEKLGPERIRMTGPQSMAFHDTSLVRDRSLKRDEMVALITAVDDILDHAPALLAQIAELTAENERLRGAVEDVYNALGPSPGCAANQCDGCGAEMTAALEAVATVLGKPVHLDDCDANRGRFHAKFAQARAEAFDQIATFVLAIADDIKAVADSCRDCGFSSGERDHRSLAKAYRILATAIRALAERKGVTL